jgi:hypothetical protein
LIATALAPAAIPEVEVGDRVQDTGEAKEIGPETDASTAVVLKLPEGKTAQDYTVDGTTIAEYNSGYPPDSPVAIIAFVRDLDQIYEWPKIDSDELYRVVEGADVQTYTYPLARLIPRVDFWPPKHSNKIPSEEEVPPA